jgi:outer membrane protein assembly factor BamB
MCTSRICFALLVFGLFPAMDLSPVAVGDEGGFWPEFRGPQRDGVSRETGLLPMWPEDGPTLLWTATGIGHGFPTASIAGGMIYTAGNMDRQTMITALDLDGRIRWQTANGPDWVGTQPGQPGARSVPTIAQDQLFHLSPVGELVALDAKTGVRQWGLNVLDAFGSENITWAQAASPLVDGQRVIVAPGGPQTTVVALDRRDGQILWQSPSVGDLAAYGSPVLVEHDGLRMIVTMTSKSVVGVAADDGTLLWQVDHETRWAESNFTPLVHDGHVFVSTQFTGSVLIRLDVQGDLCTARPVWRSEDLDNHHGGVVLLDGYLYGSGRANGGRWACLDWETGELQYLERGVGKGSVVAADGMLYTLSERGVLGLVPATPERHEPVAQFSIPDHGSGPVFAHPVVCGGRLYVRHGEFLYCYQIRRGNAR